MLVFYTLQGEEGEDLRHPNAFEVSPAGGSVVLADVLRCFPLRERGLYHFRFRLQGKQTFWMDVTDPEARVPQIAANRIVSKVLRLDKPPDPRVRLRRKAIRAMHAKGALAARAVASDKRHDVEADPAASSSQRSVSPGARPSPYKDKHSRGVGGNSDGTGSSGGAASSGAESFVPATAPMPAPAPAPMVPVELPDFTKAGVVKGKHGPSVVVDTDDAMFGDKAQDTTDVGGSSAALSLDPLQDARMRREAAAKNKSVLESAPNARLKTADGSNVWNPDTVDRSSKSAAVQAAMARRDKEKQEAKDRKVREFRERELKQADEEAQREAIAQRLGPQLRAWSDEGGKKKQIRVLLSTLHTVMWPNSAWKEVSMGKLLNPAAVKKAHRRAMLIVHPDHSNKHTMERRFVAERVFEAVNEAWEVFESAEMG